MPSDSVRLKGPALKELWELITAAFDLSELKRILRFTTDRDLEREVKDQDIDGLVFDLIVRLEKHGSVHLFLRGIYDARPGLKELRDAIERNCPEALQTAAGLAVEGKRAAAGVEALKDQLGVSQVRDLVAPHRAELTDLMDDIDVLANYKRLHDFLQTIQFTHYPQMADEMRRLRNDPIAATTLEDHVFQLDELCRNALKAAEALPDTAAVRRGELRWVKKLEASIAELRKAVEALDDQEGARAIRSLRLTIRPEPSRINALLTLTAERLPLERLVSTVAEVVKALSAEGSSPAELRDGLQSLQSMLPELKGRVAEHEQWQQIENEFLDTDDFIEQGTPDSVQVFTEMWRGAKESVAALAGADPAANWAKKSQQLTRVIDAALIADMGAARNNFRAFRHVVLFHFFQVDRALRLQCEAILAIRAPLKSLLSEVKHDGG